MRVVQTQKARLCRNVKFVLLWGSIVCYSQTLIQGKDFFLFGGGHSQIKVPLALPLFQSICNRYYAVVEN